MEVAVAETFSAEETSAFGAKIGSSLSRGDIIALFGDLGAGKTTFVKGVAEGLGISDHERINSPTFTYLNIYEGKLSLYHFDLYRLRSARDFLESGFSEYLSQGIACIEWPEHALPFLPPHALFISLSHAGPDRRKITISRTRV